MIQERKPIMNGMRPFPMLIFSSVIVITVGLIFQLFGMITAAPLFGIRITEIFSLDPSADQQHLNALKYIQVIGALGTFIFSSFLLSFLYTGSWTKYFTFRIRLSGSLLILVVLIIIAGLPFINFLTELNMKMSLPFEQVETLLRNLEEETEALMMQLIRAENVFGLMVNLFMIAVIPAIGEELVFRGLLQRHFTEWFKNGHLAILVTSIIFSLVHFQLFSFLPRFFLGIILGYFLYYGKSIWYPVIGHFVNNGIGVVFYYFYLQERSGDALEEIGTNNMMPITALYSGLLLVMLMLALKYFSQTNRSVSPGTHSGR
jgi:membrane protease YdiL (CAAX protease family)